MKPKTKKKKQTPLQQIQKQLDKLAALHAKEEAIVEKIEEIIEEGEEEQMGNNGKKADDKARAMANWKLLKDASPANKKVITKILNDERKRKKSVKTSSPQKKNLRLENQMPIVGNKKYPYTKVGIKKAKNMPKRQGRKWLKNTRVVEELFQVQRKHPSSEGQL